MAPLVVASGALRPVAIEALEARRHGDCLVARRGAEEWQHNGSGNSAPRQPMTRVGLLLNGITEHTRTATTGDLTRRSSTASLGIVQSSCEISSGEGNELCFILEGIEDKAVLLAAHERQQQKTEGAAKTMGGGGGPVRTGSVALSGAAPGADWGFSSMGLGLGGLGIGSIRQAAHMAVAA
jgi:hypothetical protein